MGIWKNDGFGFHDYGQSGALPAELAAGPGARLIDDTGGHMLGIAAVPSIPGGLDFPDGGFFGVRR
jgi:hypothetical protein